MLKQKINNLFNPIFKKDNVMMNSLTKKDENIVWYNGDIYKLKQLYTNCKFSTGNQDFFYANLTNNDTIIHSGIPALISDTKSTLLFGNGYTYKIEKENKADEELLDNILEDNNMNELLQQGAVFESRDGAFVYKLSFDKELSQYIIVELIDNNHFEVIEDRGRIQEIIFKEYFEEKDNKYLLNEFYGYGYVTYKLYKVGSRHQLTEISITTTEKTNELTDITFDDRMILALPKHNINKKSDYEGRIPEFDKLDEAFSNLADDVRIGKTDIYFPEDKSPITATGQHSLIRPNKRHIIRPITNLESDDNKIQYEQPEIRANEWKTVIDIYVDNILTSVGLNKATVGIEDVGADASGEARREREKSSLRTRSRMVEVWTKYLEKLYPLILNTQNIVNGKGYKEYDIKIEFDEYVSFTVNEKVDTVSKLVLGNVIDNEKALDMIFGDTITEDEKERILFNTGEM